MKLSGKNNAERYENLLYCLYLLRITERVVSLSFSAIFSLSRTVIYRYILFLLLSFTKWRKYLKKNGPWKIEEKKRRYSLWTQRATDVLQVFVFVVLEWVFVVLRLPLCRHQGALPYVIHSLFLYWWGKGHSLHQDHSLLFRIISLQSIKLWIGGQQRISRRRETKENKWRKTQEDGGHDH